MVSYNTRYTLRAVPGEQRSLWDTFVSEHPAGHLLQSWSWGELKADASWHPLRLALWDEETQRIVAAAQVLRRTAPHLPLRAGHLAYIPRGPVIDWSQEALCDAFFTQLDSYISKQGALALRIEPGREADSAEAAQVMQRFKSLQMRPERTIQPVRTIIVDLAPTEEELLARMKEKWRYNVRLSTRKGMTVRVAQSIEDVRAWYALLQTTSERDQFGVHTLDYYERAWRLLAPHSARLLLAEYEGQLLAGIFVSLFAHQGIYLYGASSNEQRKLMPNYLLQWEAIRWVKQAGAREYDFWGIPETEAEDEAMAGVYRFKSGWGGRIVSFIGCHERTYRALAMSVARRFM